MVIPYSLSCFSVWDYSTGRVGAPLVCSEFRLKDWEEGEPVSHSPTVRTAIDHF